MNNYSLNIYGIQNNNHKHVAGINNKNNNRVIIDSNFTNNFFINKIIRFFWLSKLDLIFKYLPLRKLFFKVMFNVTKKEKKNIYLFCNARYISQDNSLCKWIKKKDPNSIILIWLLNPLSKSKNPSEKLYRYKLVSDFVSIYDKKESQIYKINYLPLTYGRLFPISEKKLFKYDLIFLGKAKDRINLIMESYFFFKEKGLKIKYLLVDVPKQKRIDSKDITYLRNISYEKYLDYINCSKIILEIVQKGTVSYTSRALEASFYRRKLLSNVKNIFNNDFINKNETLFFDKVDDIDENFLKRDINYESFKDTEESLINSKNLLKNIISFI